jgi:hypothetical protein
MENEPMSAVANGKASRVARPWSRRAALGGLVLAGACTQQQVERAVEAPTEASVRGRSPSGRVRLDERFLAAAGEGSGTLVFQGRSHPFRIVGSVMGPGGAATINAEGDVFNLARLSDFAGRYTQSSGQPGLTQAGASELWLQNEAGVIMRLWASTSGLLLSLGRQEILILMG